MKKIKRILICAVLITVCFLLETTVFQKLAFASIIPNLLIIVTSSFGFMRGQKEGMIIGFFLWTFKRYTRWKSAWILCADLYADRIWQRIFPESIL